MCPSCSDRENVKTKLRPAGLDARIMECPSCGAVWSVAHGTTEVIRDPHANSFLETRSELVEADDYDARQG